MINESCHEKACFMYYAKFKQKHILAILSHRLIRAFDFATKIVQSLYFLLKFQASSHLMVLYSPVCVGPGGNPEESKRCSLNIADG